MLLLHQIGSVKVGEVVRYTLTYTPSLDRILPAPKQLHVKIRNTSAVPLRAAYLHGPYTVYVACYPATFDPNRKHERGADEGFPEFEPNLKAGGYWTTKLTVPKEVADAAGSTNSRKSLDKEPRSFTWIIEVQSQVIFSTTAAVHFEVLVARDEKSVDLGFNGVIGSGHGAPGRLEDHRQSRVRNTAQSKGLFSKAVRLVVDDTESLWNTPPFPTWDSQGNVAVHEGPHHGDKVDAAGKESRTEKQAEESTTNTKGEKASSSPRRHDARPRKQQKVHLVVLCHGIHSNLGADMLYLKESIDTAAKQAREDQKKRKAELRKKDAEQRNDFGRVASGEKSKSVPEIVVQMNEEEDDEDEQVLVRGFNGNAVRTEKGIQYLGKRLAKYVLSITYPDQPYLPVKSSISDSITRTFTGHKSTDEHGQPIHKNSSIVKDTKHQNHNLAYRITSISFISHSLGGLVQTYAIAYIQKHSPEFFELIKPINFVALASPFLGLSNENPIYVKFALDFGLVGRTGQDLGLTWRAPTVVRSGWGAMIGGLGEPKKHAQPDPGSKPLLRILPTGPAHVALKKFRNRSVYSNVVNDGIVPLRTSCLLFLDWRGLDRVERARRENGVIGTMVGWGWAEMTGQNASEAKKPFWNDIFGDSGDESSKTSRKSLKALDHGDDVPQAEAGESLDNDPTQDPGKAQFLSRSGTRDDAVHKPFQDQVYDQEKAKAKSTEQQGLFSGFMNLFRPQASAEAHHHSPKKVRPYVRGQTMRDVMGSQREASISTEGSSSFEEGRPGPVRGSSLYTNNSAGGENLQAPPKTTFFESAGDLLAPPLPPREFLIDPAARPRTIFHDRVYHPEDIPAPPVGRQRGMKRLGSRDGADKSRQERVNSNASDRSDDGGSMKIEEKIARAYHKDLSWRKVLVRLEPDAHNNMIVRRMFANAYGWPVVKHLCDTHFAFTAAAMTSDADEQNKERAKPAHVAAGEGGEEVRGQAALPDENSSGLNRRRSVDDADADNIVVHGPRSLNADVQHLNINVEPPVPSAPRTHSETRESRDAITELVSPVSLVSATAFRDASYASLTSASTSLTQISRSDSARWSDRFFEGEDDSSDDEEYMTELRKARARGEELNRRELARAARTRTTGTTDSKTSSKSLGEPTMLIDNAITQSPNDSTVDLAAGDPADHLPIQTTEQDYKNAPEGRAPSVASVGLGKSLEEQLSPLEPSSEQNGMGVAETVARVKSITD